MDAVCVGEEAGGGGSRRTKPSIFPYKVAAAGDKRHFACAAGAAAVAPSVMGSSSVFCNEWLFLCALVYAFLEPVGTDRIGMAQAFWSLITSSSKYYSMYLSYTSRSNK